MSNTSASEHIQQTPRGPLEFRTRLRDFGLVTWLASPGELAAELPPALELDCVTIDGASRAPISAAGFVERRLHLAGLSWLSTSFAQLNLRTYVRDTRTGERGVWFLSTVAGTALALGPRWLFGLPWQGGRVRVGLTFDEELGRARWHLSARSRDGRAHLLMEPSSRRVRGGPAPAGFASADAAVDRLTYLTFGASTVRRGKFGRYEVRHAPLDPFHATPLDLRIEGLDRWVSPAEQARPYAAWFMPSADFAVWLPPRSTT